MLISTLSAFTTYWELYHKVTFDGVNKRIYINSEVTDIDADTDLYSDWKEWVLLEDNAKFEQAFRTTGGDPLPGNRKVGQYFFLLNDWKLVPPADTLTDDIQIVGNLYTEDGSNVFDVAGTGVRLVRQVVSQYTEIAAPVVDVTVSGSGLTPEESATLTDTYAAATGALYASIDASSSAYNAYVASNLAYGATGNITASLETIITSQSLQSADISTIYSTVSSSQQLLVEQSSSIASLTELVVSGSGLTPAQATMLLEMYRLVGLDPTQPLVVSPTSRVVGADIVQSIISGSGTVVVTRL